MTNQEPAAVVRQLVAGFQGTHLVYVMAELGVADFLIEGPRSSDELASLLHVDRGALHRVLRALAHLGLLEQGNDGGFTLTSLGDTLRSDRPDSLRPLARFWGHQMMQEAWSNLLYSVRTGEPAFDHVFDMPVFAYLEVNPDAAAIYHDSMARMRAAATAAAVAAYDFGSFGTIVDVGGGNGSLLIEILRAYPQPRGIVFDLPHARAEAEELLAAAGLGSRARFDAGDFFASVTAGADCYLLRQVLHDWDDAKAETILRSCREAITPNGTLLLIELLLPEAGDPGQEAVMVDITMLVRVGGRERTEAEYRALLERTGFRLDWVVPTTSPHNILECTPV
jgi:hypothetical protein